MAKSLTTEFSLVTSPLGYFSKREITNQDPRALVKGSKNMIINDGDKVASRKGFTLDGEAGTIFNGINSKYDFVSKNGKKLLRAYTGSTAGTGKLQVRTEYTTGTPIWYDLLTSLTHSDFSFTTWWNTTEVIRTVIFVDGTTSIRMWGGGIGYIASNTATTITLSGTKTWAELGFFVSLSGRSITIPGVGVYTYTGGESTTTLTGLTALPAITVGLPAFQTVVTITSLTGVSPAITPTVVTTRENQIWYGDKQTSLVWGSKNTNYADCAFTTPLRVPGEGFKIVLDDLTIGFAQDDNSVYAFAGLDEIYQINFILAADLSKESITIEKKKTGAGQSALSRKAIIPVKNGVMYFTNEKNLTWLTSVQNVSTPQALPTSDPIKDDFDGYDLTNATGIFYENAIYIAIPKESLVYIYDFDKALWQTPQTIPVASFSIIKNEVTQKNELYGHSNSKNETYKLNDGLDDNGVKIEFNASFAYRNFGNRSVLKQFDEFFNELYMSVSTTVTCRHYYEYLGADLTVEKLIKGSDSGLMVAPNVDANLGKDNFGKNPLGSSLNPISDLNKYRVIFEMKLVDFFEHQISYISDSENAQFEILSHGPNVVMSSNLPRSIKR